MEWGFTVGALAAPCFFQKQAFSFSDKNRGFGRAKNAKNKARTHLDFPLHRYKAARFFFDCVAITHDFGNGLLPVAFNSCRFWQPPSATLPPVWLAFHEFLHNLEGFHRSSKFFCPLAHRLCIEAFRLFIRMECRDFNRLRKAWHLLAPLESEMVSPMSYFQHSEVSARLVPHVPPPESSLPPGFASAKLDTLPKFWSVRAAGGLPHSAKLGQASKLPFPCLALVSRTVELDPVARNHAFPVSKDERAWSCCHRKKQTIPDVSTAFSQYNECWADVHRFFFINL